MENFAVYNNNALYKLKLMSDDELRQKAVKIYDATHLTNTDFTLDSAIFGSTHSNECSICHNNSWNCPGHQALIELPFAIVPYICLDDWKKVIPCICPMCSHILADNVNELLNYTPIMRLIKCKKNIDKILRKSNNCTIVCPYCCNTVIPYKISTSDTLSVVPANAELVGFNGRINPNIIKNMLQNFTQYEELGFSKAYHPKNFMTNYIPIVTTKLRPKNNTSTEASLTSYYKTIIEDVIPEINYAAAIIGVNNPIIDAARSKLTIFNKAYNKLYAYYTLITSPINDDMKNKILTIVNKRDRKHYDEHNALLGRLKGKSKSIFGQGLTYTRVNRSARTVLGGAVDVPFRNICIPYHICQALATNYKVYEENIDMVRELLIANSTKVIANSETLPKILQVVKQSSDGLAINIKVTPDNAVVCAMKLAPGDEIVMSLTDTDFIYMSRFPVVREESISSYETKADSNSIITIPLPTCLMKMADFDGDEMQALCITSHNTDAEALLTTSLYSQYIAYKDGNPAIWYNADAPTGISQMKADGVIRIRNDQALDKPINILKVLESFLPKDLSYKDSKTEIANGKFISDKINMNNMELYKYIYTLYGADVIANLMHNVTMLAYDVCKDYGITLGFEIKIYGGDKIVKAIHDIKDKTYADMCAIERSNDPLKSYKVVQKTQEQKSKILQLLVESAKGTNIDRLRFVQSRQVEYYQNVVQIDHIMIEGDRVKPLLVDGTRTSCTAARFSIDPSDYGFEMNSYNSDIRPTTHFFENAEQRFAIYQKGDSVADQGYLEKKLSVAFSKIYADFNGAIVDNYRLLAPQYGASGLNPRAAVIQPLIDIDLEPAVFNKKYNDKRLQTLYANIRDSFERYKHITNYFKSQCIKNEFIAGFNYNMYIDTHKTSDKPMSQQSIDTFINELLDIFCTPANKELVESNFWQHEYYFRQKLATCTIDKEVLETLKNQFMWSLIDGGDAIGGKASLACSEPLTQAVLHSIHNAGGGNGIDIDNVIRSVGTKRFEELLTRPSGANTVSVIRIKLYDDSKAACMKFVYNNEVILFNDLWCDSILAYSTSIPKKVLELHPQIDFSKVHVNNYFMTITINASLIAGFNISVSDIIYTLVSSIGVIEFCTGYAMDNKQFTIYIFFKHQISFEDIKDISLRMTQSKNLIIHGSYIRNCFIAENANLPGHYYIECNDIPDMDSFTRVIHMPEVDPAESSVTNMKVCQSMYGTCESNARHYEELIYTATNLSATSGILVRHYKVLADCIYANGETTYADRNYFKYDRYGDALRYIQFETAKDMIKTSIKNDDINPVADPYSAIVFNDSPVVGTGASKITLYQTE